MSRVSQATEWYTWVLAQGNPRVKDWPLMDPMQPLGLIVAYVVVIFGLKSFMKNREPFDLKGSMLLHNLHLAVLSFYMMYETVNQAFVRNNYVIFGGNAVDDGPKGFGMARIIWIYYLSKIVEFGDTLFMVLRKKFKQITFLHVYHHTSIFFIWWIITYYAPGGESYYSVVLNSFIHVLMYSYYFWSALHGKVDRARKPRWTEPGFYRKYITNFQMLQFVLMLIQATYDVAYPVKDYPLFCAWILFFYMFTMLGLFGNFHLKQYGKKKDKKEKKKTT